MIRLGDRTLRVAGLIDGPITINNDGFINGVQLIVNDEIYCSLPGDDSYSEIYPTLQDGVDTDAFENWLGNWCRGCPGTHWLFWLQSSNEIAESFKQIKMLCQVLILFIDIIGILNIINTVYSSLPFLFRNCGNFGDFHFGLPAGNGDPVALYRRNEHCGFH